jgi:hypothetical protein
VYAPGAAFFVGVLCALLYWEAYHNSRALFAAGLLGGLSLGVHLTVLLLAPSVLLHLWAKRKSAGAIWRPLTLGALIGALLAVGAFLVLDWRASPGDFFAVAIQPSRSVWGLAAEDLDSPFERLAFSLGGRQFRGLMFADPVRVMQINVRQYLRNFPYELSIATTVLAALGVMELVLRQRRLALLLLSALTIQWIYAFNYEIWDIYVFHTPGYVLLALLATRGAGGLAQRWTRLCWHSRVRPVAAGVLVVLAFAAGIGPILAHKWDGVWRGYTPGFAPIRFPFSGAQQAGFHAHVTETVAHLESEAIVFAPWDILYPYYYAAHLEQGRTDLAFIEQKPHREGEYSESSVIAYVESHIAKRPVYWTDCPPELRAAGYECQPRLVGPATMYRVLPIER